MKKANLPVRAGEWENEGQGGRREKEREREILLKRLCV